MHLKYRKSNALAILEMAKSTRRWGPRPQAVKITLPCPIKPARSIKETVASQPPTAELCRVHHGRFHTTTIHYLSPRLLSIRYLATTVRAENIHDDAAAKATQDLRTIPRRPALPAQKRRRHGIRKTNVTRLTTEAQTQKWCMSRMLWTRSSFLEPPPGHNLTSRHWTR